MSDSESLQIGEAAFQLSPDVQQRLKASERLLHWTHAKLDGIRLPQLAHDKRTQLATACWHVAVEHSMAVVLLVEEGMWGSALALIRPMFEAYMRGMWLNCAATDREVDKAGRDRFPSDFDRLVAETEATGYFGRDAVVLSMLKTRSWKRLCSLTHTGYQQIGARLTSGGLGYGYKDTEIMESLVWADAIAIMSVIAFARLLNNEALLSEAHAVGMTIPSAHGSRNDEEPQ